MKKEKVCLILFSRLQISGYNVNKYVCIQIIRQAFKVHSIINVILLYYPLVFFSRLFVVPLS